jgi:hypothetical protein
VEGGTNVISVPKDNPNDPNRFITWSEQKAYALLSLARNAGHEVTEATIPIFVYGHVPYKSIVAVRCTDEEWDAMILEMYRRYEAIPEDKRT